MPDLDGGPDSLMVRLGRERFPKQTHPKLTIRDERGSILVLPYAPKVVEHSGLSASYTEAARPGRAPLVLRASDPLPVMSFEVFIGGPNHQVPVEVTITELRRLGAQRERLTVTLGPFEAGAGPWRMTSLSLTSVERQHGTNAITRATAALTFTRAVDASIGTGPVSGGAKPPPGSTAAKPQPTTTKAPTTKPTQRTHVVKAGDTLSALAIKFYRDASQWRRLADANKVRDPRKLRVGQRLVIP